ncbi:MAG TPA: ABC transporter ATP-binding protein [Chloroflexota bacterium]|nr:ABC transporter ATP-binding protein [Chloroflexota bacterium]
MNGVVELNLDRETRRRIKDTDAALVVNHINKSFGGKSLLTPWKKDAKRVKAVDDVTIGVRRGEIYGLLGANGSGKSTLIRLIATLLLPDDGSVTVFGHDVVREAPAVQRMLNRVSVEASLFKKLSPMENLIYAARLYSVPVGRAKQDIVRIMEALGVDRDRVHKPVDTMSRGMQQKVAIARALLTSPVLMLLDEPTTGLDPRSKKDVEQFIRDLRDEHDATILLTSHDMHEAEVLCDRLAIIEKGRIVVEGTPQQLKDEYAERHGLAEATLEDVFMEYTGHGLEDEDEEGATA